MKFHVESLKETGVQRTDKQPGGYRPKLCNGDVLLNRFGSGVQGHQAMVKFEKRRQRDDESIDKFLDDLELLRRRSNPD